ncbi:MAG TPA: insulinase family protein [Longimicrobiales bacterium]|nr:insulinase family protein [Longimicrobiales bacterium]
MTRTTTSSAAAIRRSCAIAAALFLAACGGGVEPGTPAPEGAAPVAPAATAPAAERLVALLPEPAPVTSVDFPAYTEATLDNGTRVIVVENHEQPVVSFNLRIRTGTSADPGALVGLANMTAGLIDKGTATRGASEIAEAIDFVGGSLSAGAGNDWTSLSVTVLTEFVDTALTLLSDIVLNPTFPGDELENLRRRTLTALELAKSQPAALAQERFTQLVYGPHPYGKIETEGSIRAIQRTNLLRFHRQHYRPNNALFVVAGDVNPADVVARLNRAFAEWTPADVPAQSSSAAPTHAQRRLEFVHKPGSVQGVVRVGHLMPSATEADWPELDVAMQVLGGSTGWLFEVLREDKGWTYGAYASANERRGPGIFTARAEARNEVADSAIAEMLRLIEQLRDAPVDETDLRMAKEFIAGSFPRSIETSQQVASQIATEILLGRGPEYVESYRDRVASVTAADVQRVARQYLNPAALQMVVVGDALQIFDKVSGFADRPTIVNVEGGRVTLEQLTPRASEMAFDAARLETGTRTYAIMVQGNRFGDMTMTLVREGDAYVSRGVFAAGPMRVEQNVAFGADFTPISAELTSPAGSLELANDGGRVTGTSEQQGRETRTIDLTPPQGTLFPGMSDYAVEVADLRATPQFTIPVITEEGTLGQTQVRVVGDETIDVPAGSFETIHLEQTTTQGTVNAWVRKEAPHILVQQDMPGAPVLIQLSELE